MQANPCGDGPDSKRPGRLRRAESVERTELEHRALGIGQSVERCVELTRPRLGVDPFLRSDDVIVGEQSPPLKPRVYLFLACRAPELAVDYVPRYTEQPQCRRATTRAIRRCRIDCCEEHFRREVCRQMRIGDASRNETLHGIDVLAVEHLEYIGIVSDPRHFIGPHIPTWYQPAEALHRTPTPNDECSATPAQKRACLGVDRRPATRPLLGSSESFAVLASRVSSGRSAGA